MKIVSDEEWGVMTIYGEARGEPQDGRIAVAEVILARAQRRYQSDGTIPGTCLFPHAFSCWATTDPNRRVIAQMDDESPVVQDCLVAWRAAIGGSALVKGAVHYLNRTLLGADPPWLGGCRLVAQIGRHSFYAVGVL